VKIRLERWREEPELHLKMFINFPSLSSSTSPSLLALKQVPGETIFRDFRLIITENFLISA
jgi:hypothetical protein